MVGFTLSTLLLYINTELQREELSHSVHVSSWISYQAQLEYAKLELRWTVCLGDGACDGDDLLQQAEIFASRLDILANSAEAASLPYVGKYRGALGALFDRMIAIFDQFPSTGPVGQAEAVKLAQRLSFELAQTGHLLQDLLSDATLYNTAVERREAALRATSPVYPFALLGASGLALILLLLSEVRRRDKALSELASLRDEERRQQLNLQRLLATLPLPVCVIIGDGQLAYSNSAAQDNFGSNLDGAGHALAVVQDHAGKRLSEVLKLTLPAADGQQQAFIGQATPVEWQDQSGMVWILNAATSEGNAQLQALDVGKMALLGELSSGIAHELNQPLATIKAAALNAELLLARPDNTERIVAKLQRIAQQVDRISQIVLNIRKLSRPVSNDATFCVQHAIASCLMITRHKMTLGGIDVRVEDECDSHVLVRGDQTLLEICIINILLNARDAFMTAPQVSINDRTIEIRLATNGAGVQVRIRDTAGGISPHILPRIFESFVSSKSSSDGMGVGLAISRRAVTQMGGQISATNIANGAEFLIELPTLDPIQ